MGSKNYPQDYLNVLEEKSRLMLKLTSIRQEKLNEISQIFEELSLIPEIKLVLQVAAMSEQLRIFFCDESCVNSNEHEIRIDVNCDHSSKLEKFASDLTRYVIETFFGSFADSHEETQDEVPPLGTNFWMGFKSDVTSTEMQQNTENIVDLCALLVSASNDQDSINLIKNEEKSFELFAFFTEKASQILKMSNEEQQKTLKRKGETTGEGSITKKMKGWKVLEQVAKKGSLANFKESLGMLDPIDETEFFIRTNQTELGMRLLMIAVVSSNTEVAKYLSKCGLDLNFRNKNGETVADIAFGLENYEVLQALLLADSGIPKGLCYESLSNTERFWLHEPLSLRKEIHSCIEHGKINELKKSIDKSSGIKFAYIIVDQNNQCALTTALKERNFKIYSLLRSKGFAVGVDSSHDVIMKELTENEKLSLDQELRNYFKAPSVYILNLVSQSRLGLNNDTQNFKFIETFYESLDETEDLRQILKIAASNKKLSIVFDFNRGSIRDLDVTNCDDDSRLGCTKPNLKTIFIGAKRDRGQLLGTLAHELAHHALQLVYQNNFLPYYQEDMALEGEFQEIVFTCLNVAKRCQKVGVSYDYDIIYRVYPRSEEKTSDEKIAAELIVRVPHLIALHAKDQNKLEDAKKDFKCLFDFYNEHVKPDFNREEPFLELRRTVQDINNFLGVFSKLETSLISCKGKFKDEDVKGNDNVFLRTQLPEMALQNWVALLKNHCKEIGSMHIFIRAEQLHDERILKTVLKVLDPPLNPKVFVLDTIEISAEKMATFWEQITGKAKVVFFSSTNEKYFDNIFSKHLQVEFKWNDLTDDSKESLLDQKFCFQDAEILLSDVLDKDSDALQNLPLEDIVSLSNANISSFDDKLPPFPIAHVERSYKSKSAILSLDQVLEKLETQQSVLIADSAGMGKSTTAIQIARLLNIQYEKFWVVFIDLKQHTACYRQDQNDQ